MSRAEKAKEKFLQGYNCSQAVALAFSDVMGLEEDVVLKMMLPFGGGIGRLRMTCGAISGMVAVVGMLFSKADNNPENKKETYAIVQELCAKFKAETGSLICAELLSGVKVPVEVGGVAEARTAEYYKKRPCADMVALAAQILEEYLQEKGKI